jgi:hypothetical protein
MANYKKPRQNADLEAHMPPSQRLYGVDSHYYESEKDHIRWFDTDDLGYCVLAEHPPLVRQENESDPLLIPKISGL